MKNTTLKFEDFAAKAKEISKKEQKQIKGGKTYAVGCGMATYNNGRN